MTHARVATETASQSTACFLLLLEVLHNRLQQHVACKTCDTLFMLPSGFQGSSSTVLRESAFL
jgi:hypothetical protein